MSMIDFWVDGEPKGQPRPRAFAFNGKARVYDPGTAEGWKSMIAIAARTGLYGEREKLEGPLALRLRFFFPRPKSHFRTRKTEYIIRDDAPTYHTGKPDSDNAAKAVMDALTQIGVWNDDAQICKLSVTKEYGSQPGCRITITSALLEIPA